MTEYHKVDSCNRCGGKNEVKVTDTINMNLAEANTHCLSCGFDDYWAYGFFESGQDMESNCQKYSFSKIIGE